MPSMVVRYFRVMAEGQTLSQATLSQWAQNPAACKESPASVDGTIYGFSCYLDGAISRATKDSGTCASSKGVTIYPRQVLPFLSSWTAYPETATVKSGIAHTDYYTSAEADSAAATNTAIYQAKEGDYTQVLLGYRKADTGDFSLVYFRTGDSGAADINVTVVWGNTSTSEFESYATDETMNSNAGYTRRVLSKGGYVFHQYWNTNSPSTVVTDSPNETGCYSATTMQDAAMTECQTAMGGTSMATGTQDSLFFFLLFDWDTTTALTGSYFLPSEHTAFSGNAMPTTNGCF